MSYLITVKVRGDIDRFEAALAERDTEFKEIGARAQSMGAIHHRFGMDRANGVVLAVDEWADATKFEAFFGDPAMQEFVASIGADTSVPPEITIVEAISSPDQF